MRKRLFSTYVVLIDCAACGQVHTLSFKDKSDFLQAVCQQTGYPVFSSVDTYHKVYKNFLDDVRQVA